MYDTILFVDFDGTITAEETMGGIMKNFTPKFYYARKGIQFLLKKITLADLIHFSFDRIPSSRMPEIMEYVRNVPIRPGFEELLKTCKELGITVVILSGGVAPCVREKMKPYEGEFEAIYAVEVDTSGPVLRPYCDYEGEGYLMRKELVLKEYDCKRSISIGDSYSDFRMGKAADIVFARDTLAKELDKNGLPYYPWTDFYDVERVIRSL